VPLAAALERIVLPQGMRGKLLGHQDAAQVGMPLETGFRTCPHLAFHPIRAFPKRHDDGTVRSGSLSITRMVNRRFAATLVSRYASPKPIRGAAESEVVDAGDVHEQIESPLLLEPPQNRERVFFPHDDAAVTPNSLADVPGKST